MFFLDASDIKFFPQGLVMSFYGVAGSLLATYLWQGEGEGKIKYIIRLIRISLSGGARGGGGGGGFEWGFVDDLVDDDPMLSTRTALCARRQDKLVISAE